MNRTIKSLGLAAAFGLAAAPAMAQEKLKIGLLLTLSGPSAVLGQQARDVIRPRSLNARSDRRLPGQGSHCRRSPAQARPLVQRSG